MNYVNGLRYAALLFVFSFAFVIVKAQSTIFPSNAVWSYLDTDTRPTGWPSSHDASAWATGAAPLGYSNGVTTTVSYGGNASNKYITTYFNKVVNIPNVASYGSFTINLVRDDGAILYINGIEVVRSNMPNTSTIGHSTFASSVVNDGAQESEVHSFEIAPYYLVNGDNVFSLELHQVNLTSSDLSFSVEFIGNDGTTTTTAIGYGSNWKFLDNNTRPSNWETSGFNDASWNIGHGEFGYGDGDEETCVASGGGGSICSPSGNKYTTTYFRKTFTIADPSAFDDFELRLKRDDGAVVYVNGVERYRTNMPGGTILHSTFAITDAPGDGEPPITTTLDAAFFSAGVNVIAVEIHQNSLTSSDLSFNLELIGNKTIVVQPTIIPFGSTWYYLDNNTRPTNWETIGYDHASWSSGIGKFGYGDAAVVTCVQSGGGGTLCDPTGTKYTTTYFRKRINISDPTGLPDFTFRTYRDDGIVVYVNGDEVFRSNMNPGAVTHNTFSIECATDDGADIQTYLVPSSAFVAGINVIAVELHQCNATSSDLIFDMELLGDVTLSPPATLINFGDDWKYLDNGSNQGSAWQAPAFDDGSWSVGPAELGYGDGDESTVVSYGGNANNKYTTTYFRKTFNITDLNEITSLSLNVIRDDGVVVYINGTEVATDNMPAGVPAYNTFAVTAVGNADETTPVSFTLSPSLFIEGTNVIAVEIHQANLTSSDVSFDLELIANSGGGGGPAPILTRGPYLQVAGETAITLRWRTDIACFGRVNIGTSNGVYTTTSVDETSSVTEHIVRVTGLTADTKYYYQIAATDGTILQGAADNFFTTNPSASTTRKIRITAFGDCGRNSAAYQDDNLANYLNYLSANGIDAPDAWILMGDNAYNSGTDAEYTSNFFNIYGNTILKNHKLFPSPGNHDYGNSAANKTSRSMPYHNIFSVPQNGESGGVASTKQNYYSYDIGNIHFLSLDSYGIESDGTSIETAGSSALKTWVDADLAANTKKWVIAYWHHPPYTKSSHNSDSEGDLVNIRQNFIDFLENRGVDLIICGHSHAYERGYLIKNYNGNWSSFNAGTHAVSSSSATYTSNSTCPYVYNTTPADHGTVYVVAGSSGASGGTNSGFASGPMPFAVNDAGIFYFEIEDNRLDAKMLRRNGTIFDQFTIMKDVNATTNYNIPNGSSQQLTASWPQSGNYTWTNTVASNRSTTVMPPDDATTVYTVTDDYGCITDQFSVTTSAQIPVPVTILNFDVKLQNKKATITWSTTTESNNNYFTIERSANGASFNSIAQVPGAGNSTDIRSYSFVDENPLLGTSFYRLSQTDYDAKTKYIGIRRINNLHIRHFEVKVLSGYSGKLVLQINSEKQGRYNIRVIDMSGREWVNQPFQIGAGVTQKEFNLSPGVYIWEVRDDKGEALLQKTILQ